LLLLRLLLRLWRWRRRLQRPGRSLLPLLLLLLHL
jgi:hypothetical protein